VIVRRGTQEADIRPARPDDLAACAEVWQAALSDYLVRLGQTEPLGDIGAVTALYGHLCSTDPDTFLVATRPDDAAPGGERVVGFVVALVRGDLWFLSMLFVLPEEQGIGLGRTLLERVLPRTGTTRARMTATDSAQPISNALYSRYGMVPRVPLLHLLGDVRRPDRLSPLPGGIVVTPFDEIVGRAPDGSGHRELAASIGRIDAAVAGFEHPDDHRYLRLGGRQGYLYVWAGGEHLGYGYTSAAGRVGPVAVHDAALVAPILGHLLQAVTPRGAFATWVAGSAGDAVQQLLAAGLRLEGFPILLCWDEPLIDLRRYLPISPGLL